MVVALPHGVVVGGGDDGVVVVIDMVSIEFESVCEVEIMSILTNRLLVFATTFHCSSRDGNICGSRSCVAQKRTD